MVAAASLNLILLTSTTTRHIYCQEKNVQFYWSITMDPSLERRSRDSCWVEKSWIWARLCWIHSSYRCKPFTVVSAGRKCNNYYWSFGMDPSHTEPHFSSEWCGLVIFDRIIVRVLVHHQWWCFSTQSWTNQGNSASLFTTGTAVRAS